jgi:hypothetical protein
MRTRAGLAQALESTFAEPGVTPGRPEASDTAPSARFDELPAGETDVFDLVRLRLRLGEDISDMTIAVSLATIAGESDYALRRQAAASSPLGRLLARPGEALDDALSELAALAQLRFE